VTFWEYLISGVVSASVAGILCLIAQKVLNHLKDTLTKFGEQFGRAIDKLENAIEKMVAKQDEEANKRERIAERLAELEGSHKARIEEGIPCRRCGD